MLDIILKKIGFESAEAFVENEKRIMEEFDGFVIERRSPLAILSNEERRFFRQYCNEHNLI